MRDHYPTHLCDELKAAQKACTAAEDRWAKSLYARLAYRDLERARANLLRLQTSEGLT